jgi:HK97 gp10 family phage protein
MLNMDVWVHCANPTGTLAEIRDRLREAVEESARELVADAKRRAPVDTGALRDSLHYTMTGPTEATAGDGVEYGIYQEFGTVHMPAQPFLVPATADAGRALSRRVREIVGS